jgi:Holliday junction resolvase RusA-like endonuclease
MYLYKITFGSYEYEKTYTLQHKFKYNKPEFENIIKSAYEYMKNNHLFFYDEYKFLEILDKKYGFKSYKPKIQANIKFNWYLE